MKLNLTNELTALKEMKAHVPLLVATRRRRFTTLNTSSGPVAGTDDLTHAWDGWLFVVLAAGAVWPIIHALGVFN